MFTFKLFGKTYSADTLAEAAGMFSQLRDESGRGASTMPLPEVLKDGGSFGHFSYNGKIWEKPSRDWTAGMVPLFTPHVGA